MELVPNQFSSYALTPLEEKLGTILSPHQKAVLHSKRADIAAAKLQLKFDTANPVGFAQDEAYMRGQLDAITWLMDSSDAVQQAELESQSSQQ